MPLSSRVSSKFRFLTCMRVNIGSPRPSHTFDAVAAGWTPLTRLESKRYVWLALMIGLPCFLASLMVLSQSVAGWKRGILSEPGALVVLFASLLLVVPAHEFIHALAYRCGLRSPNLILGIWPQRFLIYVLYDGPLSRGRVLFMLAAPFLVLSVLPLCVLWLLPADYGSLTLYFVLVHTSACSGDAVTFMRLLKQAPPRSLIHNQGESTYWGTSIEETRLPKQTTVTHLST